MEIGWFHTSVELKRNKSLMKRTRAITELFSNISPLCVGSTVATNHNVLFQFICKLLSLHWINHLSFAGKRSTCQPQQHRLWEGKKKREKEC